ncbi:MAG: PepSY domain-containing protein [Hyphomonas sp.]
MMKFVSIFVLAGMLAACQPDAQTNNAAIATDDAVRERQQSAPATGATSFTEGQAQDHLRDRGYTNPSTLQRTDSGEWTGTATLNGRTVNVSVDYQGNIVETP